LPAEVPVIDAIAATPAGLGVDTAFGLIGSAAEHHFRPEGEPTDLVTFGTRDYAGVAIALGIPAHTVRTVADLERPLDAWLARPEGPFVLDAKIDPGVRADQADLAFSGGH
jgi:thiamine pyrophosphate-dependent acetolactate synthase large subunit-like protein